MSADIYEVKLENIFEGPMDLLVHLIKKNEVDIYDIPIALITDQYLAYLEWMKAMNIDFAGDFLVMASTLMQIKSRMLLPVHSSEEGEEDDPRLMIAKPIMEYLSIKSIAEQLSERHQLGEDIFSREPMIKEYMSPSDDEVIKIGLFELIDAFQKILDNIASDHQVDLTDEKISIKDRISELVEILESYGTIPFNALFPETAAKGEMIITFLAILEMARIGLIQITQHVQSGIIRLFYL